MRKKLLSLIFFVLGLMILSACSNNKIDIEKAADELINIYQTGDSEKNVTKDLNLKTKSSLSDDIKISWNSNNTDVIKNDGKVTRPNDLDVEVKLTVTLTYDSLEANRTFNLVVKKIDAEVVIEKITVIFNFGYEGSDAPSITEIEKNTKVKRITNPIRSGYKFLGWFVAEQEFDFNTNILNNLELTAKWEKLLSISLPENVTSNVGNNNLEKGTSVTISITVPENKELSKLLKNGIEVEVTNNEYTFIIEKDVNVEVEFIDVIPTVEEYTVIFNNESVVVTINNNPINSGDKVEKGLELKILVNIPSGKVVKSFKLNNVIKTLDNNIHLITLIEDLTIDVEYEEPKVVNKYSLTLPSNVKANVEDLTEINEDTSIVLTIDLPKGKELVELVVNNKAVQVKNNTYTFKIKENTTVEIELRDIPIYYTLTLPEEISSDKGNSVLENTKIELTVNIPQFDEYYSLFINGNKAELIDSKYYDFVVTMDVVVTYEFNVEKLNLITIEELEQTEELEVFIAAKIIRKTNDNKYLIEDQTGQAEITAEEMYTKGVNEYVNQLIGKKVVIRATFYDSLFVYEKYDVIAQDYVEKEKYEVIFNSNEGTSIDSQSVTEGNKVNKPANPEKTNSIFSGWYIDQELTTEFDFNTQVTKEITLYAKWSIVTFEKTNNYTISEDNKTIYQEIKVLVNGLEVTINESTESFVKNGKLYLNLLTKDYNDILSLNDSLIEVEYTVNNQFRETTVESIDGEFKYNIELQKFYKGYNILFNNEIVEVKSPDFILTARNHNNIWTEGLLTDTGSGIWLDSEKINGEYRFIAIDKDGVIYDALISFNVETKVYEVDSIEALEKTIEINKLENQTNIILTKDIIFDEAREINFKNKVIITGGKKLQNVYLTVTSESDITEIEVVNPEKERFVVTFDFGYENKKEEKNVLEGQLVESITDSVRDGYVFAGWFNGEVEFDFNTPVTSNLTLSAKWNNEEVTAELGEIKLNDNVITITFNKNVKYNNVFLGEVRFSTEQEKINFLNEIFVKLNKTTNEREKLTLEMLNTNNIEIIFDNDSIMIEFKDDLINRDIFKFLETSGDNNGVYRMLINSIDFTNFKHAINNSDVVSNQEDTSFRIKFASPFANGIADLDGLIKTTIQNKEQWTVDRENDPVRDSINPELVSKEFKINNNNQLVLSIKASDENLKSLEIDHNLENVEGLKQFTVYADAKDPYQGKKNDFDALGVKVEYNNGEWIITFGEAVEKLIKENTNEFIVYFVVRDYANNSYGSMNGTNGDNTVKVSIYTVTLSVETVLSSVKVFENAKLNEPEEPNKKGFKFIDWLQDEDTVYDFNQQVNNSFELIAQFIELQTYNVKYFNLYQATNENEESFIEGNELNDASREGFDFVGWFDNPELNGERITEITNDLNLYAKWNKELFTESAEKYEIGNEQPNNITIKKAGFTQEDTQNGFKGLRLASGGSNGAISFEFKDQIIDFSFKLVSYNNEVKNFDIYVNSKKYSQTVSNEVKEISLKSLGIENSDLGSNAIIEIKTTKNNRIIVNNFEWKKYSSMSDVEKPNIFVLYEMYDIDINNSIDILKDVFADDNSSGDITSKITFKILKDSLETESIDWTMAGRYTVIYSVVDNNGNVGNKEISIDINDWNKPIYAVENEVRNISYVIGDEKPNLNNLVSATNKNKDVLTVMNNIEALNINWLETGEYIVKYYVDGDIENAVEVNLTIIDSTEAKFYELELYGEGLSTNVDDLTNILKGTRVIITITIPEGKKINKFTLDGEVINLENNEYIIESFNKNYRIDIEYINVYTVLFDLGYETSEIVQPQEIIEGGYVAEPVVEREGYSFSGWYTDINDEATKWSFGEDIINSNVTLYAKWLVSSKIIELEEKFTELKETGSYSNGIYNGSSEWEYKNARTDQKINNNKSVVFSKTGGEIKSKISPKGIKSLSFDYKRVFSGSGELKIYINDILIDTVSGEGRFTLSEEQIIDSGEIVLKIVATDRTGIANIKWSFVE